MQFKQDKLNLMVETQCLYNFLFWKSSRHKTIKMAAVATILNYLIKQEALTVTWTLCFLYMFQQGPLSL